MSSIEQLEQMSKIMLKYTSKFGAHWHCLTYIGKSCWKFSKIFAIMVRLESENKESLTILNIAG